MDELVQLLKKYEIVYLIDVRSKPYSKFKPEYSKHELEQALDQLGIKYIFMGDLLGGQPDLPSCYTPDGKIDYSKLREKDFYKRGIERLNDAWQKQLLVVVMCSEQKPEMCHRSKLIGESLSGINIPVQHIDENGSLVLQEDVMLRLTDGQLSLFGAEETNFTSRKKYQKEKKDDAE
ncbi:MAG: DUF488 domain-containing protein [Chloroflexota bacterium]